MADFPLTPRQAEILEVIRGHIAEYHRPPSQPELAKALGLASTNGVFKHLAALERKGAIELSPGLARGIRIKEEGGVPLVGRVAAGSPILAEQHLDGRYQVDPNLFTPRADYLLRVRGMSMRDAGILEGDLLAVHRTQEARTGQVVVARLADEVTVKRFRRRGHSVQLLPENPDFEPIEVDLRRDTLSIEGVAVGVIRNGKGL
jgi:repressor LexA